METGSVRCYYAAVCRCWEEEKEAFHTKKRTETSNMHFVTARFIFDVVIAQRLPPAYNQRTSKQHKIPHPTTFLYQHYERFFISKCHELS
jgi:hypothetical protein